MQTEWKSFMGLSFDDIHLLSLAKANNRLITSESGYTIIEKRYSTSVGKHTRVLSAIQGALQAIKTISTFTDSGLEKIKAFTIWKVAVNQITKGANCKSNRVCRFFRDFFKKLIETKFFRRFDAIQAWLEINKLNDQLQAIKNIGDLNDQKFDARVGEFTFSVDGFCEQSSTTDAATTPPTDDDLPSTTDAATTSPTQPPAAEPLDPPTTPVDDEQAAATTSPTATAAAEAADEFLDPDGPQF